MAVDLSVYVGMEVCIPLDMRNGERVDFSAGIRTMALWVSTEGAYTEFDIRALLRFVSSSADRLIRRGLPLVSGRRCEKGSPHGCR